MFEVKEEYIATCIIYQTVSYIIVIVRAGMVPPVYIDTIHMQTTVRICVCSFCSKPFVYAILFLGNSVTDVKSLSL